ncbi:hypothetical protein N0V90_011112 [Kalmusia sp. IMI 367209]|nr:hypothetical protein N0V90_011112 [Kalmusia sp. IMI 367209]
MLKLKSYIAFTGFNLHLLAFPRALYQDPFIVGLEEAVKVGANWCSSIRPSTERVATKVQNGWPEASAQKHHPLSLQTFRRQRYPGISNTPKGTPLIETMASGPHNAFRSQAKTPSGNSVRSRVRNISSEKSTEAMDTWLLRVTEVAKETGYSIGIPTTHDGTDTYDEDENLDLVPNNPTFLDPLRGRFLYRLATMFGNGGAWDNPTIAMMREENGGTVFLRLCKMSGSHSMKNDEVWTRAAAGFVKALNGLHNLIGPVTSSKHYLDLWNIVFQLYKNRSQKCISEMMQLFSKHQSQMDDLTSKMLGTTNDAPMALDVAIGDTLIRMHGLVHAIQHGSTTDQQYNAILRQAHYLYRLEGGHIQKRLGFVLGSAFGNGIYHHITILAQPKRAFNTFVRTARALNTFSPIDLKHGLPPISQHSQPSTRAIAPQSLEPKPRAKLPIVGQPSQLTRPGNPPKVTNIDHILAPARAYLSDSDRHIGPLSLKPLAKRNALMLTASVIDGQIPNPDWEAYYAFGYPACETEEEVQKLGGLYREILTDAPSKTTVFGELWRAVQDDALPALFDKYGWSSFRDDMPGLERFLHKVTDSRESVYRLIQFLRSRENTDPPPVLIRDYGFHRCKQREQVAILKEVYMKALGKLGPRGLHEACVSGKLREAVASTGMQILPHQHRLLENQWPNPTIGFEAIIGSFISDQGLFKRR